MLYSIVDVGSNTVRIVTYDINGNSYTPSYTDYRALGLVSEIENGKLRSGAVNRLCETLALFKKNSPKNSVFCAFATAFMREIDNSQEVVSEIKRKTDIHLEILSEENEALFSFNGITRTLNKPSGIAADFGGGSCEFIKFHNNIPVQHTSFPFGCVKLAKMFIKDAPFPSHNELSQISDYVTEQISNTNWIKNEKDLILTGGTARAFAQLDNFLNKTKLPLSNYTFTRQSFQKLYTEFTSFDSIYTDFIKSAMPNREKTIYPGFAAVKAIIDYICCETITISSQGVREGYLANILGGERV